MARMNVGAGVIIGSELAASGAEIGVDMLGDQFGDASKKTFGKISTWAKVGIGAVGGLAALLLPASKLKSTTRTALAAFSGHMIAEIPELAMQAMEEGTAATRVSRVVRSAAPSRASVGRAGRSLPSPVPPGRVAPEEVAFPKGQSWARFTRR